MITKGQRVQTPLGVGTVLGFETFTANGMKAYLSDTDQENNSRVAIQLDRPENWAGYPQHNPPYFIRSEISEIKE